MNLDIFEAMEAPQLRNYIAFLLWHYRVMDSFWYIYLAEQFGDPTADRLNEKVWGRISGMAAKDLTRRFDIRAHGLERFVAALRLWPWCILVDYRIEQTAREVFIAVPSCPTQEARTRRGLEKYDCREMHRLEFDGFARAIDPRIETECLFAPPEPCRDGLTCRWRFTIKGE
jgi:hypothetical protein